MNRDASHYEAVGLAATRVVLPGAPALHQVTLILTKYCTFLNKHVCNVGVTLCGAQSPVCVPDGQLWARARLADTRDQALRLLLSPSASSTPSLTRLPALLSRRMKHFTRQKPDAIYSDSFLFCFNQRNKFPKEL